MCDPAPRPLAVLSLFEVSVGYALLTATDRRLLPSEAPQEAVETDVDAASSRNVSALYHLFVRATGEAALKAQHDIVCACPRHGACRAGRGCGYSIAEGGRSGRCGVRMPELVSAYRVEFGALYICVEKQTVFRQDCQEASSEAAPP